MTGPHFWSAGLDFADVRDAAAGERFRDSPLVTQERKIRLPDGAALVTEDGYVLGTLCVMDRVPRTRRCGAM